jgi:hypothetical protein
MKYYEYLRTMNYAHIYNINTNEFLTHVPPCQTCLIQTMCLDIGSYIDKGKTKSKLFIKACKDLDKFMEGKKCFKKLNRKR